VLALKVAHSMFIRLPDLIPGQLSVTALGRAFSPCEEMHASSVGFGHSCIASRYSWKRAFTSSSCSSAALTQYRQFENWRHLVVLMAGGGSKGWAWKIPTDSAAFKTKRPRKPCFPR